MYKPFHDEPSSGVCARRGFNAPLSLDLVKTSLNCTSASSTSASCDSANKAIALATGCDELCKQELDQVCSAPTVTLSYIIMMMPHV